MRRFVELPQGLNLPIVRQSGTRKNGGGKAISKPIPPKEKCHKITSNGPVYKIKVLIELDLYSIMEIRVPLILVNRRPWGLGGGVVVEIC